MNRISPYYNLQELPAPIVPAPPAKWSWPWLTELEPRLQQLRERIEKHDAPTNDQRQWHTWWQFKMEMMRLVGWTCRKAELQNCEAFDAAYRELLCVFEDRCDELDLRGEPA